MSGEIESGTCDICGTDNVPLNRKYYHYDIKCECHSPSHFEMVRHCKYCVPEEPRVSKFTVKCNGKDKKFTIPTDALKNCVICKVEKCWKCDFGRMIYSKGTVYCTLLNDKFIDNISEIPEECPIREKTTTRTKIYIVD